jgi:hypothetical protein
MTPQQLLRSLARLLPLLLLLLTLALPHAAFSQPAAPGPAELTPEARARLAQAAEDSLLAPWQRDLMLRMARTGTTATLDSSAAELRTALPARASGAEDGAWNQLVSPVRDSHSAIYDPVHDRMVVFGSSGTYLNNVWVLSLAGTPAWTQLTPSGTPPSGRSGHSAIYDPGSDCMVVFGGYNGSTLPYYLNDVWALSLSGAPAWTQLTPSGTPPSGRDGHNAIYDPVRDRMVMFGGAGPDSLLNDVWVLSLLAGELAWTQLTPSGTLPIQRSRHSAIYDPVRDCMVVFGGYDESSSLDDVWALSLVGTPAWTELTTSGTPPTARGTHSAIYDPVRDCMVVFGGWDGSGASSFNDVWALTLVGTPAWTELTPSGTPPIARGTHSAIYDPVRDRMVVFGGWDGSGASSFNDVWALSLAGTPAWTQLTPSGSTPPSGRTAPNAIYDPVRDRMVVFGGYYYDGSLHYFNDVWALSLAGTPAWTELTPSGTPPRARYAHSAIYDPVRDRMVVFGGCDDYMGSYLNDVWALSLAGAPAWTELTPLGTPPSARRYHSAIYDSVRDRIVVFGGYSGSYLNDIWALSLAGTPAWTQLTPSGASPGTRRAHSAIYDPVRDRMVVFGGTIYASARNDVWALSLTGTLAWMQLTPLGTPPIVRGDHSAIYDPVRDRMVVFGGRDPYYFLNDVWALSLAGTQAWTELTPSGSLPSERNDHSAIYDPMRDRMVVFGGYSNGQGFVNDVWALWWSGIGAGVGSEAQPLISYLRPPAPNPTRGTTTVSFALAQAGRVQLGVYDVSGRLVRQLVDGERRAGTETVVWNGTAESGARLQSGIYFVRLAAPGFRETRRVVLLK